MIKEFIDNNWPWFLICIISVFLIFFVYLCIQGLIEADNNWSVFAKEHNCKIIKQTNGKTNTGFGLMPNGQFGMIQTFSSGEICWECDDGVTYCR